MIVVIHECVIHECLYMNDYVYTCEEARVSKLVVVLLGVSIIFG